MKIGAPSARLSGRGVPKDRQIKELVLLDTRPSLPSHTRYCLRDLMRGRGTITANLYISSLLLLINPSEKSLEVDRTRMN